MTLPCRVALVLCGVAATTFAQSSKPAGRTQRDLCRVQVEAFRQSFASGYAASTPQPTKFDADARAFLDRMAVRLGEARFDPIYRSGTDTSLDAVLPMADKLTGCENPLVGYVRYMAYRDAKRGTANWLIINQVPKVPDGPYAAYWRYVAAADLARANPKDKKWPERRDQLLAEMLLEKQADPQNRRNVLFLMRSYIWNVTGMNSARPVPAKERQALLDTLARSPEMDPWLLDNLLGRHEMELAWELRGGGWANTVTPAGWAGFAEHLAEARKAFESAHARQPDYPDAASALVTVSMGQGRDAKEWFRRAIANEPDAVMAWEAYAETLRPRWGGTVEAMLDLGIEAGRSKRFDTELPRFLIDVLAMTHRETADRDAVYRRPGLWQEVGAVFDGYLAGPSPGIDVPATLSEKAAYAWRCGAFDEAHETLNRLGNRVRPAAFEAFGVSVAEVREECAARVGPRGDAARQVAVAVAAGDFAEAAAVSQVVISDLPANDPARRYFARQKIVNTIAAALAAGRPADVPLADADAFSAFRGDTAAWKVRDGALVYAGKPNTAGTLLHATDLPPAFRLRMEWSWTAADPKQGPSVDLIFRDTEQLGMAHVAMFPKHQQVRVRLGPYGVARSGKPVLMPVDDRHVLVVEQAGDRVTVEHDSLKVIDDVQNDWLDDGRRLLGFTAHNASVPSEIRIHKLTIESLSR